MEEKQKIELGEYIIDFFKNNPGWVKHTNCGHETSVANLVLNKIQDLNDAEDARRRGIS